MAINPHHTIEELNGTRCSVIEKKITADRAEYIKSILESSGEQVQMSTDDSGIITLGVKNVQFNVLHALYARSLKTKEGKLVTPAIWYQSDQTGDFYWGYAGK